MNLQIISRASLKAVGLTLLLVSLSSTYSTRLVAQSAPIEIRFIPAKETPPPDRGTPPAEDATGSRGDCIAKEIPLAPLVGGNNLLSLTVSDRPTFWVYVPYTSTEAPSGEFSLQDESGENDVWKTNFQLPSTPGIVSITLPSTHNPLEIDKTYRWYFDLDCPRKDVSNKPTSPASVTGLVRLVSRPEIENLLKAVKTPLERITIYAQNGLWYNTITEIAQLRLNEPQNQSLEQIWTELLSDRDHVGLARIAKEPIVGNVKTNSPPE